MKAKHTPGPWETKHREGTDGGYRTEVFSAAHGGIATCDWTPKNCGNGVTSTYREANARLIAAAPELLEACKKVHAIVSGSSWGQWSYMEGSEVYEDLKEAQDTLSAAIAKATGQTE